MLSFTLSKPGWIIKSIIIYNEVLFEGSDSLAVHPQ
jgi:Bardet-Biedl syndrome 2 protein